MPVLHLEKDLTEKAFSDMRKNAEKMRFERSGLVPKNVEEYSNLKICYRKLGEKEKAMKAQQNLYDLVTAGNQKRPLVLLFDGKLIGEGNIGILGFQTIWARHWTPTDDHPLAPWPSDREFREEGDERYTSNYGRFFPIPRVPGNATVAFKHKSWNTVEVLDKVMPVPKLYAGVNINQHGFFDATVDENGVPYDDEDLDGNEHIVEKGDVADVHLIGACFSGNKNVQSGEATIPASQGPDGRAMPPHRVSRLRAMAAPFVSRVKKVEDIEPSNTPMGKCMNNMKTVFGSANADRAVEQENFTPQANFNTGPGMFGFIGDKRPTVIKKENPFAIQPGNLGDIGSSKVGEKKNPLNLGAHKAECQTERPLASHLDNWFNTLNAGLDSNAIVADNGNTSSYILPANATTMSSRKSSASQYNVPALNSSPCVGGNLSSLGLYSPGEFSSMYAGNRPA